MAKERKTRMPLGLMIKNLFVPFSKKKKTKNPFIHSYIQKALISYIDCKLLKRSKL